MVAPRVDDRPIAAISHLGVPFFGLLLPYVIWTSSDSPWVRGHARQAFALQVVLAVCGALALVAVMATTTSNEARWSAARWAVVGYLVVGLALEAPNVIRALRGAAPYAIAPDWMLREH